MANLNVGCDFSKQHVNTILKLVEEGNANNTPNRITGVYGSPQFGNPFGSVRPSSRETYADMSMFLEQVARLKDADITVNLTINSLHLHIKQDDLSAALLNINEKAKSTFHTFMKMLDGNIDNLIIAHPGVIDLVEEHDYPFGIVISTIMDVHSYQQAEWIKDNWRKVIKICPALWIGRDFNRLCEMNKLVPLELLANEFCSIGGVECSGLYRQACYLSQSLEMDWNPMLTRCIRSRALKPSSWLKAKFILPQWIPEYEARTSINNFKITGRTHNAEFIDSVARAYMYGKYEGNLLDLWGQLEATLNRADWKNEQEKAAARVNIPADKLDSIMNRRTCSSQSCGCLCKHCDTLYEDVVNSLKGVSDGEAVNKEGHDRKSH